jgi:uncharacterized protein with HEPN domain
MVFDAIRMRLLEIGEAANGIPLEFRAALDRLADRLGPSPAAGTS